MKGFGPKSFQQAAGFLRIFGGAEPLDGLPIHPESYGTAKAMLARREATAADLGIGTETFNDVRAALKTAEQGISCDPRQESRTCKDMQQLIFIYIYLSLSLSLSLIYVIYMLLRSL